MAKLLILITPQVEKALAVAEALEAAGAPGVTLIESYGLHRLREKSKSLEIPLFVSIASLMRQMEETNQTILVLVGDDMVDRMIDAACEVLGGDMSKPDTGIAFVIDVERTFGVKNLSASEMTCD
ncbi:MAG: hypothetical protein JXJ20_02715 [Anaerolineae bacterium]|jgi:nitrogen regulatory protein PII|nr:hypothetical protein [Anaerolineae bacterium]